MYRKRWSSHASFDWLKKTDSSSARCDVLHKLLRDQIKYRLMYRTEVVGSTLFSPAVVKKKKKNNDDKSADHKYNLLPTFIASVQPKLPHRSFPYSQHEENKQRKCTSFAPWKFCKRHLFFGARGSPVPRARLSFQRRRISRPPQLRSHARQL